MGKFVVLAAALLVVSAVSAFAEESCQLTRYAVIPYETNETAQIYIPATLGGRSTRLLLDTGSYWSVVSDDLAKSLNLTPRPSGQVEMVDLSGAKINTIVTVPSTTIGTLKFGASEYFVGGTAPGQTIEQLGGLLGQNLLTRVDLEIDGAAKTISLFSQDHCPGAGVYWADEAVTLHYKRSAPTPTGSHLRGEIDKDQIDPPIVWAQLEGEDVAVLFDTGATYTSMDLDLARRRFGIHPDSPGVQPANEAHVISGKAVQTYSYTFKTLTVGGISFENVPARLGRFEGGAQIVLGMNELKHLHLYFAFKEGAIYVTAADAGRPQK